MAILFTNLGKQKTLEYIVGKDTTTESLVLKLYSNDATPAPTDTVTTYTEVTGGGYSSITLNPISWTVTNGDATYPEQTWTFTGSAGNVYGYYLVNQSSNQLIFAERFSGAPYTVAASGDIIRVTLNLSLV